MKRTPFLLFLLSSLALLAACANLPAQPNAAASDAEIAAAVQATLTAVAADNNQASASQAQPAETPIPAQSRPPVQLPAAVPDWRIIDNKPGASRGSADAPVVLIEYSDFQCPWCTRFHKEVMPELEPLIEGGELRFVYKQFAVLGPDSVTAALATECALAQGDFWTLHDWLFEQQAQWKGSGNVREAIVGAVAGLGYDADVLDACLDAPETMAAAAADYQETQKFGFRGTPSFVLNGRLIPGFLPAETMLELISVTAAEALGQELPAGYVLAPTPPPLDTDFEDEDFAVDGSADAPVTIYEFSDYQCPFCLRFFQETKPLLDEQYIDTGKVRFVYKDFPIDSIHAQARLASEAAECAGAQDAYWEMHDRLFAGKDEWADNPAFSALFKGYAVELGLDSGTFDNCLDNGVYSDEVQADLEEGQRAGVTGTPTFFINGQMLVGAQPFEVIAQAIENALNEK